MPVVNNTDRDWIIKVNWLPEPNSGNSLMIGGSINKEMQVAKKSTKNLPVIFKPNWICNIGAKLTLNNPVTLDQFEYDIKAIG